jgi:hypothetical protein
MPLSKLKNYLLAGLIVLLVAAAGSAVVYQQKYQKQKANRERLEENQAQLLKEKANYILIKQSLDEFKATISARVDSVLRADRIKPKQVERIVERHFYYRDTSYVTHVPDPVVVDNTTIYPFTDLKDCFTIRGFMELRDAKPAVTITDRKFENSSVDIAYIEREKKFLGIRFGRWKGRLKTINQCGATTTKEIEIVK